MKTIPVIDDQLSIRMLIKASLEEMGYQVETAADGAEGWEKVVALLPDLVITDLNMPGVYGLELLERIRNTQETAAIPVLCVTADDNIDTKQRAILMKATGWVQKPFHADRWGSALKKLLGDTGVPTLKR